MSAPGGDGAYRKDRVTYDLSAVQKMQSHYDRHAGQFKTVEEANQSRKEGPAFPLKRFHNDIKKLLIERFTGPGSRLLDLCCGRGGDLWKWVNAGVEYVKGLDLSPGEIEEARTRYKDTLEQLQRRGQGRGGHAPLVAEFDSTDQLGQSHCIHGPDVGSFDAVSCMFAAHYFFVRSEAAKMFLANVSRALKDGGYFFGTVPSGAQVLKQLGGTVDKATMKSVTNAEYRSPMLVLKKHWEEEHQPFGSPYICAITDTVTEGHGDDSEGSFEYLVFFGAFLQEAKQYGLYPVNRYDAECLEAKTDADPKYPSFRQFKPNFPGSHKSLAEASQLFYTFAFRKGEPRAQQQHAGSRPPTAPYPGAPSTSLPPRPAQGAPKRPLEGGDDAAAHDAAAKKKRPMRPGAGMAAAAAGVDGGGAAAAAAATAEKERGEGEEGGGREAGGAGLLGKLGIKM